MNEERSNYKYILLTLCILLLNNVYAETWQEPSLISGLPRYASALHADDINGDGTKELIAGYHTNGSIKGIEIWSYDTDAQIWILKELISKTGWHDIHDIASGDFDKDGDIDLVATMRWVGSWVLLNQGIDPLTQQRVWTQYKLDNAYGWQVEVADFDYDECSDIMVSTETATNHIRIFYGSCDGKFLQGGAPVCQSDSCIGYRFLKPIDINNDGTIDLIGQSVEWKSGNRAVYLRAYPNQGNRAWLSSIGPSNPIVISSGIGAGDINSDGHIDFVGTVNNISKQSLILFWGPTWTETTELASFQSQSMGLGQMHDINGDGGLDIAVSGFNSFNGIKMFYGDGQGNFPWFEQHATNEKIAKSFIEYDFNRDGINDIIFINNPAKNLKIIFSVNAPPNCDAATTSVNEIWPPNHQWVDISILNVTDPDGDAVNINVINITSDEPTASDEDSGGPKHAPDAQGFDNGLVQLRSERSEAGDGRVYGISFSASDSKGATCWGYVTTCVPYDQDQNEACVDSGQNYNAVDIN